MNSTATMPSIAPTPAPQPRLAASLGGRVFLDRLTQGGAFSGQRAPSHPRVRRERRPLLTDQQAITLYLYLQALAASVIVHVVAAAIILEYL